MLIKENSEKTSYTVMLQDPMGATVSKKVISEMDVIVDPQTSGTVGTDLYGDEPYIADKQGFISEMIQEKAADWSLLAQRDLLLEYLESCHATSTVPSQVSFVFERTFRATVYSPETKEN